MNETALDFSRLEEALGGEVDLVVEILQMYADTAKDDLTKLHEALAASAVDDVVKAAHTLKGASANVGAERARARAAEIEHAARAGDLQLGHDTFPALQAAFDAACDEVARYIRKAAE